MVGGLLGLFAGSVDASIAFGGLFCHFYLSLLLGGDLAGGEGSDHAFNLVG